MLISLIDRRMGSIISLCLICTSVPLRPLRDEIDLEIRYARGILFGKVSLS